MNEVTPLNLIFFFWSKNSFKILDPQWQLTSKGGKNVIFQSKAKIRMEILVSFLFLWFAWNFPSCFHLIWMMIREFLYSLIPVIIISLCHWGVFPSSVHLTNISWLNLQIILGRKLGDIFCDWTVSEESIYWEKPVTRTVSMSISKKTEITTSHRSYCVLIN